MADSQSPIAKLKQEVRGLLLSSSRGVTLTQFLKDYKESIGRSFPFREFGYDSISGLLRDMSDVVKIAPGTPVTLVPVSNERVNHINNMVAKQKQTTSKYSIRSIPRRSVIEDHDDKNIKKPAKLPLESKSSSTNVQKHFELNGQSNRDKNFHFNNDYSEATENRVSSHNNNYEDSRSYKNQYSSEDSTDSRYSHDFENNPFTQFEESGSHPRPIPLMEIEAQITGKVKEFFNRIGDVKEYRPNVADDYLSENDECYTGEVISVPKYHYRGYESQEEDLERPPTPGEIIITEKMKNNFRELLSDFYPEGIPSSKFCKLYKEKFGVPLSYFNYGVKSINEMIANIPDVFTYQQQRSSHQDWILYDIKKPLPTTEVQRWIPNVILKNITELCQQYPEGLKNSDILILYRQRFNAELDFQRLGFKSLDAFIQSCSSVKYVSINGENMVVPIFQDSPNDHESHYALPPISEMPYLWGDQFSENECSPSMTYRPFKLIEKDKLSFAKIYVCDVISPSNIWLQMDEQRDDLDKLMYNLNLYYDKYEEKHKLTDNSFAIKDLICTVRFPVDKRWHRAKIISESSSDMNEVTVLYIDYGTIGIDVSFSSIRKLIKEFYYLPVQAIQASLYGLMPTPKGSERERIWTSECVDFIFELLIEKKFNIDVTNIDESVPKLEVILHDDKFTVNDQLLAEGHAISIGHMPLGEDNNLDSELNQDAVDDDIPYPSMLQESLSVLSNVNSDHRIRTPPGYSSRTVPPQTMSKGFRTTSSSTCQRINELREDSENICKKLEQLLELARQKFLEADVLENHVCKHPHPIGSTLQKFSKLLLCKSDHPGEISLPIENSLFEKDHKMTMNKSENVQIDLNRQHGGIPASISLVQGTGNPLNPPQDPRALTFQNEMMNHNPQLDHHMTENSLQSHQIVQHQQYGYPSQASNKLTQQLPPFQPFPQQMPPNVMHNKMAGPPLIVQNQTPPYVASRVYAPYNQQSIIYPQNIGPWAGGQWGGGPPIMPPNALPISHFPYSQSMYHPSLPRAMKDQRPPQKLAEEKTDMSESSNIINPPYSQNMYPSLPSARSLEKLSDVSISKEKTDMSEDNENNVPSNELPQPTPALLEEVSEEAEQQISYEPSAPPEELNNFTLCLESESEHLEQESSTSPLSSCIINTSHLSQKQREKLKSSGEILIPPPSTNNWSELYNLNTLPASSTITSTISSSNDSNQTKMDLTEHEKPIENENLVDEYKKLNDAITETMGQSKVAINHIMKICVENIHDQSSNILLLLIGDSVAVLLRQLFLSYWWGLLHEEYLSYNDFISNLRDTKLPAYSIFYTDHKPVFERLRDEKLIAEDDMFVYVVDLSDVSYILDFICPKEKHDLTHIKNIFTEIFKLVLPVDEFWYKKSPPLLSEVGLSKNECLPN